MSGPSMRNPVGGVYLGDVFMRHPLTTQNQEELDIAGKADSILNRPQQLAALMRVPEGGGEPIAPIGFSLNDVRYLGYPQDQATASELGLRAYWNMGVPVVDEVSRVEQPPPDMVSRQTYINGTDPVEMTATDTVEFSISNTLSWSLQGDVQLTFGATASAQVEAQLEKSVQAGQSQTTTLLNSKDDVGVNAEFATEGTSAVMATGTATGTGEVSAQLLMGLSASVGGELTTSWTHTSEISLTVSSRVDVMATTYREIRQFLYSYGVTYGGWVA
ncbi:gluconolaconase, partial [Streptomyces lavendulae]|uniref:gluconolaconase n=1 Tax=Streptomyces lavendulae TaxID=1914 RepID=UPI003722691D